MLTREYQSTNFITGLRAIAILMVFLIHSGGAGLREMFSFGDRVVDMGKYGVDIFFVISGFTIFYQFYNRNYTFKDFLLIRILRVSIPYFPLIIGLYIFVLLGGELSNYWAMKFNNGEINFTNFITHIFYVSFLDVRYANAIIGVEWTLSIEVFYYFLLGYLILKVNSLATAKGCLMFVFLFFLVSVITIFIAKQFTTEELHLFTHWLPVKYGYMFLLGGLAYHLRSLLFRKYAEERLKKISDLVLILAIVISSFYLLNIKIPNIGFINELFFASLTFMCIVFISDASKFTKILTNRLMIFIGSISFSIYLLHMIVLKYSFFDIGIENKFFEYIYFFTLTMIVSFGWYYLFEAKIYTKIKKNIVKNKEC